MAVEEVADAAIAAADGVDLLITALDAAFQYLEDEEIPEAIEKGLYSCVRDPRKERYTTYVNRRRLEHTAFERVKIFPPTAVKGYCTLRFAR